MVRMCEEGMSEDAVNVMAIEAAWEAYPDLSNVGGENPTWASRDQSLHREVFANGYRAAIAAMSSDGTATFQSRVQPWMMVCFGPEISADKLERNDRFIEEALELAQASNYPKERAHQLVEYVYNRPQGEINQEVGGVMVTLAAHCLAHGIDMHAAAETELARVWTKVEQIRAKQANKPKGSALPQYVAEFDTDQIRRDEREELAEAEKWILQHPAPHSPDHACRHCVPHSDILVDGFVCAYHRAAIRARSEGE